MARLVVGRAAFLRELKKMSLCGWRQPQRDTQCLSDPPSKSSTLQLNGTLRGVDREFDIVAHHAKISHTCAPGPILSIPLSSGGGHQFAIAPQPDDADQCQAFGLVAPTIGPAELSYLRGSGSCVASRSHGKFECSSLL